MNKQQVAMVLQGLRGGQPLVVLAYLAIWAGKTIQDLQNETGLSNDAVSSAIKGLEAKGMLVKQVGQHGRHVYLPVGDSFFGYFAQSQKFLENQNPVFPDSGELKAVAAAVDSDSLLLQQQHQQQGQNPVFPDSGKGSACYQPALPFKGKTPFSESVEEEGQFAENLATFKELEIFGKRPRQIAQLPWVNPDYIRAHVLYARSLGWPDNPEGYALEQMASEVPAPELKPDYSRYDKTRFDKKGRAAEVVHFTFDLDESVANFTGHEKGCKCFDCVMIRANNGDTRILCPDCKHFRCTCADDETDNEN